MSHSTRDDSKDLLVVKLQFGDIKLARDEPERVALALIFENFH